MTYHKSEDRDNWKRSGEEELLLEVLTLGRTTEPVFVHEFITIM